MSMFLPESLRDKTENEWWEWSGAALMPTKIRLAIAENPQTLICGDDFPVSLAVRETDICYWNQARGIIEEIIADMASMGFSHLVDHIAKTPQFVLAACVGRWAVRDYIRSLLWGMKMVICRRLFSQHTPDHSAFQNRYEIEIEKEIDAITDLVLEAMGALEGFSLPLNIAYEQEPDWNKEWQAYGREYEARDRTTHELDTTTEPAAITVSSTSAIGTTLQENSAHWRKFLKKNGPSSAIAYLEEINDAKENKLLEKVSGTYETYLGAPLSEIIEQAARCEVRKLLEQYSLDSFEDAVLGLPSVAILAAVGEHPLRYFLKNVIIDFYGQCEELPTIVENLINILKRRCDLSKAYSKEYFESA